MINKNPSNIISKRNLIEDLKNEITSQTVKYETTSNILPTATTDGSLLVSSENNWVVNDKLLISNTEIKSSLLSGNGDCLVVCDNTGVLNNIQLNSNNLPVDASGFNGNLTTSDDTVQECMQKLDDLILYSNPNKITKLASDYTIVTDSINYDVMQISNLTGKYEIEVYLTLSVTDPNSSIDIYFNTDDTNITTVKGLLEKSSQTAIQYFYLDAGADYKGKDLMAGFQVSFGGTYSEYIVKFKTIQTFAANKYVKISMVRPNGSYSTNVLTNSFIKATKYE